MPSPGGNYSYYTQELGERICEVISTNPQSNPDLCKMHDFFPPLPTLLQWIKSNEEFRKMYYQAKLEQTHVRAEDLIRQADDDTGDVLYDDKGKPFINPTRINRLRAKAGVIQWHVAKLNRKVFGDQKEDERQSQVEHDLDEMKARIENKNNEL